MRTHLEVPILAHEQLAEFEFELTLQGPQIARDARPGQFLQILYDQTYNPFTRRPFSVYRVDPGAGTFSIVYLARGVFTQGLRNKRPGQNLSVVGPLGKWFTPAETPDAVHVLVGGGVGAPPLYFLAETLARDEAARPRVQVINGARSRELLVGIAEFDALGVAMHYTTDDGSHGRKGLVTDALVDLLAEAGGPVQVYTCGPTPMLRAVGALCLERGIPCQVSVETMMPCGLGVCMGCVVKIKDDSEAGFSNLRSCYEGPVFNADEIIWE
jgi:dihydroorotate dehydrogenase electron transfer subunit